MTAMSLTARIKKIGPAWLAGSLNIGGGSLTTGIVLGAAYGYQFNWVYVISGLALIFTIYGVTKLSLATGEYPITLISKHTHPALAWANGLALLITDTVFFGTQVALGAASLAMLFPGGPILWGVVFIAIVAFILLAPKGTQQVQTTLKYIVIALVLCFLAVLFVVPFHPVPFFQGFTFIMPTDATSAVRVIAVLGMCLALDTCVIQSYASINQGWTKDDLKQVRFETAATQGLWLVVMICVSIGVTATLYANHIPASNPIEASKTLTPLVGSMATIIFGIGLFGAALTTAAVIPMVSGFVVADMLGVKKISIRQKEYLIPVILTLLFGLTIPLFQWNAFQIVVWGAAFNASFMVIGLLTWMWLLNKETVMGAERAGSGLNLTMGFATFVAIAAALRFWYSFFQ